MEHSFSVRSCAPEVTTFQMFQHSLAVSLPVTRFYDSFAVIESSGVIIQSFNLKQDLERYDI